MQSDDIATGKDTFIGQIELRNSVFRGNGATQNGGAFVLCDHLVVINNSIVDGSFATAAETSWVFAALWTPFYGGIYAGGTP